MKKLILLISAIAFLSLPAFGQGFNWGLKGGISQSTISLDIAGETLPSTSALSGAVAGAYLQFDLLFINLQVEALYAQKGYNMKVSALNLDEDYTLNYLSIPAIAKFYLFPLAVKPFIGGGIEYSQLLSVSGEGKGKDDFNSSDFGAVATVGIDFGLALIDLSLDVRYIYGLNNVSTEDGFTLKNQSFQATLGVSF